MTWLHRYRLRHYLRNSIWVYPIIALLLKPLCKYIIPQFCMLSFVLLRPSSHQVDKDQAGHQPKDRDTDHSNRSVSGTPPATDSEPVWTSVEDDARHATGFPFGQVQQPAERGTEAVAARNSLLAILLDGTLHRWSRG
jgi:hypothetical protein